VNFDPDRANPKSPKPIVAKFQWRDHVPNVYHQNELNPPKGIYARQQNAWLRLICLYTCLSHSAALSKQSISSLSLGCHTDSSFFVTNFRALGQKSSPQTRAYS